MTRYPKIDLTRVRTVSVLRRKSKVRIGEFAKPFGPPGGSFRAFAKSLPRILAARELGEFVNDVAAARGRGRPVVAMLGAHVIKVGLSPVVIDLVRRNVVTCIAMNSAAAIHDVETAMWGRTSEDVEENLRNGTFGMARETGEFVNGVLREALGATDVGYGEALGAALRRAPNRSLSVLASCARLGVPVTVHAAIGTDIVHQQPSMDGAATGELTFRDFRLLCMVLTRLNRGVVMNVGSAVILPEIFLKALTVARNLGYPARNFTTANFDMQQHYRPRMNIVQRPTSGGGRGYLFTGHHEIMLPLVAAMIKDRLRSR